jgi:spore germination protein GerM
MHEIAQRQKRPSRCTSVTKRLGMSAIALALVLAALPAAGCGQGGTTTTPGSATTTTAVAPSTSSTTTAATTTVPPTSVTSAPTTTTAGPASPPLTAYFVRDEKMAAMHRVVGAPGQLTDAERLAEAVRALLKGPNASEKALGASTAVPEGTKLLGVTVDPASRTATVDLSTDFESGGGTLSMTLRLAQMVFTLTQLDGIQNVLFALDGTPVTVFGGEGIMLDHAVGRADYENMAPAILVESVAPGDTVTSPLKVSGTALVFEAVFRIQLLDAQGTKLVDQVVTASSGTSTRGTFSEVFPFPVTATGPAKLVVFADSPKDGSPIDLVEIPVTLGK